MGLRGEMWLAIVVGLCLSVQMEAQLQYGFYRSSCYQAESLVRDVVARAVESDVGLAAGLVRMHFHDCFVRGCDGSVLIDSTSSNKAEKDSPINNPSLRVRVFEVIDSAKTRLEDECQGVVSCADILTFAARDSVELRGGPRYEVPGGRRDGRVSLSSEPASNIPAPTFDVNQLTQNFANKDLTQDEMVTLSGAHNIGRSHCTAFSSRLYNFNSTTRQDPSLDATYAEQLKQECPQGSTDTNLVVPLDPRSPNDFDSSYYHNVLDNRGLFTSDQTLMSTDRTMTQVWENARDAFLFNRKFAEAVVKMGQIEVLTGSDGEIRTNCRVIN